LKQLHVYSVDRYPLSIKVRIDFLQENFSKQWFASLNLGYCLLDKEWLSETEKLIDDSQRICLFRELIVVIMLFNPGKSTIAETLTHIAGRRNKKGLINPYSRGKYNKPAMSSQGFFGKNLVAATKKNGPTKDHCVVEGLKINTGLLTKRDVTHHGYSRNCRSWKGDNWFFWLQLQQLQVWMGTPVLITGLKSVSCLIVFSNSGSD
jgi:hypothetical protein